MPVCCQAALNIFYNITFFPPNLWAVFERFFPVQVFPSPGSFIAIFGFCTIPGVPANAAAAASKRTAGSTSCDGWKECLSFCLFTQGASQRHTTEPSLKRLEINDLSIRLIRSQGQWQRGGGGLGNLQPRNWISLQVLIQSVTLNQPTTQEPIRVTGLWRLWRRTVGSQLTPVVFRFGFYFKAFRCEMSEEVGRLMKIRRW